MDLRAQTLRQFRTDSLIGLAVALVVAILAAWWIAGRMLGRLHAITRAAHQAATTAALDGRLNLGGPDDEVKELGDTFDTMLEQLQRAFDAQRRFVANASHELRTPLSYVQTAVDVAAAKHGSSNPELAQLVAKVSAGLERTDQLLTGLLALAQSQHEALPDPVLVSLDALTAQALKERTALIADRRIAATCEGDAVAVVGSPDLLRRMVENLIDNAIRHNAGGGWLRASTRADGAKAIFRVENGGPVLAAADVQRLGAPFQRLGPERMRSDGAGLGLSIVAAIVAAHHGTLRFVPRPAGGLDVIVMLKLAESPDEQQAHA